MEKFTEFLKKEVDSYRKLSHNARMVLWANFMDALTAPIGGLFINAFLFRETGDVLVIALYNLGCYSVLPLGFYINAVLMKKFKETNLYVFAFILFVVVLFFIIRISDINYFIITIYGMLVGISAGIYWGNRNLLTLKTTTDENRHYFLSIESSLSTIANIIVPVLFGFFISVGFKSNWYSIDFAYSTIPYLTLLGGIFAWFFLKNTNIEDFEPRNIRFVKGTPSWNRVRFFEFIRGLENGVFTIVPSLLILSILGKEDVLGGITSFSTLISVVVIYFVGKNLSSRKRFPMLLRISLFNLLGVVFLSVVFNRIGVIFFIILNSIIGSLISIINSSIIYKANEISKNDEASSYALLCDTEIFLDGGRNVSIFIFILINLIFPGDTALRFILIIASLVGLVKLFPARAITKGTMDGYK